MSEAIKRHYLGLLSKYGDTFECAQYSSRESQEARFRILSEVGDLQNSKVLDFGCGTGHLATYLKNTGISCEYTGVDIVEEFFPLAREKNPEARFGRIEDYMDERFDYVFVSGVFNNKLEDNMAFFKDTVGLLYSICRKGISFNLMSTYVDYQQSDLWYVEPELVFKYIKSLTPYLILRNDYVVKDIDVPFEFTVYAYRHSLAPDR